MGHTSNSLRARWQENVLAKAYLIEYQRDRLAGPHSGRSDSGSRVGDGRDEPAIKPVWKATSEHLAAARQAAGAPPADQPIPRSRRIDRLAARMSGASIDAAFVNLHAAEVVLVDLYGTEHIEARAPDVLARLRTCLPATDDRRKRAEAMFGGSGAGDRLAVPNGRPAPLLPPTHRHLPEAWVEDSFAVRRAAFRDATQVSYEAADELYARVRSFRNVLVVATAVLSALIVAVCVVGAGWPQAIPLCFGPSSNPTGSPAQAAVAQSTESYWCPSSTGLSVPHGGDVSIVALMGLLGGALSATFTIQRLRGSSIPYGIPVALSVLKLPAGALTGIVGLILVHGEFIPGLTALDSQGQILAYAILLGFAQQLATRFIDRKAEDVLNSVPNKERPPGTGQRSAPAAAADPISPADGGPSTAAMAPAGSSVG